MFDIPPPFEGIEEPETRSVAPPVLTVLQELSAATGLEESTCLDLLNNGWTLVENTSEVNRWEGPMSSLKAQRTSVVVFEDGE